MHVTALQLNEDAYANIPIDRMLIDFPSVKDFKHPAHTLFLHWDRPLGCGLIEGCKFLAPIPGLGQM